MKKHALEGWGLDWRALSTKARASGISYLLSSGKTGEITDPWALRVFYTRLYLCHQNIQKKAMTDGPVSGDRRKWINIFGAK
jgi:hypothetical protein